jgi:hypothetical protein
MTSVGVPLGDDRAVRAFPDFIETVVRGQATAYLVEYDSGHLRKVSLNQ